MTGESRHISAHGRPSPDAHVPASADELARLTQRHAEGDPAAFGALSLACTPWLARRLRWKFPAWARQLHLDEDIIQETLLRLAQRQPVFRFDGQLYNWLKRTLHSVKVNTLTREHRHATTLRRDPRLANGPTGDGREGAFPRGALLAAIASAPPRDREVLVLHFVSACTHDEVAARLGISRSAAVGRWKRARDRLVDRLSEVIE